MKFAPSFLGAWLTGAGKWQATLSLQTLSYTSKGRENKRIHYESIYEVTEEPGLIWDRVTIKSDTGEVQLDGLTSTVTRHLADAVRVKSSEALLSQIESHQDFVISAADSFDRLLHKPTYLSSHDLAVWTGEVQSKYEVAVANSALRALKNPLFPWNRMPANLGRRLDLLSQAFKSDRTAVRIRNESFVVSESREH